MSKETLMRFQDGVKPIAVGDDVCVVGRGYRRSDADDISSTKVVHVGRKLVEVGKHEKGNKRNDKFYLETGYRQSQYSNMAELYSSVEAYKQQAETNELNREIKKHFSSWSSIELNRSQAERILAILKEGN